MFIKFCIMLIPDEWLLIKINKLWLLFAQYASLIVLCMLFIFIGSLHHFHWWNRCCWFHKETMGRAHKENTASTASGNGWFWAEWGMSRYLVHCFVPLCIANYLFILFYLFPVGNNFDGCNKLTRYSWSSFDKAR